MYLRKMEKNKINRNGYVDYVTIKNALEEAVSVLKSSYAAAGSNDSYVTDASVLLCHVIKCDRAYLYTHKDYKLDKADYKRYLNLIERRKQHEPVAYITGECEFMSLKFVVNNSVLIPRPETEILIEETIKNLNAEENNNEKKILDIGTGSGCIAISLAKYIKNSCITAVDISSSALEAAKENALINGVENKISFLKKDIFTGDLPGKQKVLYDAVVSNPPYIKHSMIKKLQPDVRDYEPLYALDGGEEGLDYLKYIINHVGSYLKPGGFLALETGYDQADKVAQLMENKFKIIGILKDLSGIKRVVTAANTYT